MYIDFSGLFHLSSKDRMAQGRVKIQLDQSQWPSEWKVIEYKDYPRFEKLALPVQHHEADLFRTMENRISRRDFIRRPLPKSEISALLKFSCGSMQKGSVPHRAQPSGGARYPIEAYALVFAPSDVPAGVYHYNIKEHALDVLWTREFTREDVATLFTYPWAKNASMALIFSGVFRRNQIKYGERGYRQILIETGAIVQNAYLVAQALNMQCCAIDGVREAEIEQLLDIDGISESVICSMVFG
jgi:SagB-type dehydrogenase family enzyme